MKNPFDVVIIGGSHAGLSAALVLGRSLRNVLVIDGNRPRNFAAERSHNLYTRDGENPLNLLQIAKSQIGLYKTVSFMSGIASALRKNENHFEIRVDKEIIYAGRIILATGVKDILPDVNGLADLWGTHIFNCPYCHGWELRNSRIALITADKNNIDFVKLMSHWISDLTLFTRGFNFIEDETAEIKKRGVRIIIDEIAEVKKQGEGECKIIFAGKSEVFNGVFIKSEIAFNNELAVMAGCSTGEPGEVLTDQYLQTSVPGIYAAGDLIRPFFHQIGVAAASGLQAGISVNASLL
jgi:thioredoxin reductase